MSSPPAPRAPQLSDEDYLLLCDDWDGLFARRCDLVSHDYVLDGLMLLLAATVEKEQSRQTDPNVIACLESCVEHLRTAAMDYYVSTK